MNILWISTEGYVNYSFTRVTNKFLGKIFIINYSQDHAPHFLIHIIYFGIMFVSFNSLCNLRKSFRFNSYILDMIIKIQTARNTMTIKPNPEQVTPGSLIPKKWGTRASLTPQTLRKIGLSESVKTTFMDRLYWVLPMELIQTIVGEPITYYNLIIKDYAGGKGLAFSDNNNKLQTEMDVTKIY